MLAVMDSHGLCINVRLEGVMLKAQVRKLERVGHFLPNSLAWISLVRRALSPMPVLLPTGTYRSSVEALKLRSPGTPANLIMKGRDYLLVVPPHMIVLRREKRESVAHGLSF
jgi:hypothetical protein